MSCPQPLHELPSLGISAHRYARANPALLHQLLLYYNDPKDPGFQKPIRRTTIREIYSAPKPMWRKKSHVCSGIWDLTGRDLYKGGIFSKSQFLQWDLFGAWTKLILLKSIPAQKIVPRPDMIPSGNSRSIGF